MSAELSQDIAELLDDYVSRWPYIVVNGLFVYFFEEHKRELEGKCTWGEIKQAIEVEIIRRKRSSRCPQNEEKAIRKFYGALKMMRDKGNVIQIQ